MAWEILQKAKVMRNTDTGDLGIQCSCGGDVITVCNTWRDVTEDFTWHESIVPVYYAAMAGNKVIQLIAQVQLLEVVTGEVHLFETTKWRSKVDSAFPIMVVHSDGTVLMIDASHWPDGYITADLTGVSTSDTLHINIFVPVE